MCRIVLSRGLKICGALWCSPPTFFTAICHPHSLENQRDFQKDPILSRMEAGRLEEDDRSGDNARARTLEVHTMEAIMRGPFQSAIERLTIYLELPPLLVSDDSCVFSFFSDV